MQRDRHPAVCCQRTNATVCSPGSDWKRLRLSRTESGRSRIAGPQLAWFCRPDNRGSENGDRRDVRYFNQRADLVWRAHGRGRSLAHWESRDGFDWRLAQHPFVTTPEIARTGGARQQLDALERPQLIFDARGVPLALLCAGAYEAGRARSFNVATPLRQPEAR